ncbi:MAG: hypothetical protein QOH28_197 [Actinomycetota bacterium]|jgi:sugar lactone lactonase YvrE|nr:hypothetical protein [Actinomycetota bacterium]
MRKARFGFAVAALLLIVAFGARPAGAKQVTPPSDPGPTVVATGLLNPRGLAFAPNGTLYVAEAGSGGPVDLGGGTFAGTTSRISAVNVGGALPATSMPVVTGLISVSSPDGSSSTGADGLSIQGGRIVSIITGAHQFVDQVPAGAAPPDILGAAKSQLGRLIKANPGGQFETRGDVGGTDFTYTLSCQTANPPCDPNSDFPDANPYGVLALPDKTYVTDAGANTLDVVRANGSVQILAYFHDPGVNVISLNDEVPTCIAQAGGQLYIGTLNGRVWRYNGTSTLQQVPLSTPPGPPVVSIGGCTADAAGNLYLSDQFGNNVWKMAPGGATTIVAAISDPSGIVVGPDGFVYVSANSSTTNGQIMRLQP